MHKVPNLCMPLPHSGVDHVELTRLAQEYFGKLGDKYEGGKILPCAFTGGEVSQTGWTFDLRSLRTTLLMFSISISCNITSNLSNI